MAGSALVRRLASEGCEILIVGRADADLRRQDQVERWMEANRPDTVLLAAATVGGIHANSTRPADFIYDNLIIEANVIHTAFRTGVQKLLLLGSSCIYPRMAPQPMAEDALLTGPLEPTNEAYAVAKIAGIKLCQAYRRQHGCNFIAAMPTNLYGAGDNYHPKDSHVVAAVIRKIHEAKVRGADSIQIWGTGKPLREFLYVEDMADGLVFLLKNYADEAHINIGTGQGTSIAELAGAIAKVVGWGGRLIFDSSMADGMPVKIMDVSRLKAMGWQASTRLEDGLACAYRWYLENVAQA